MVLKVLESGVHERVGTLVKARDNGKCLWCSANHNALCQLANQSRLRLSEGTKRLREVGHRGLTIMYSI